MGGLQVDSGVIIAVVLVNAVIGIIQEGRAQKALDAIRNMLSLKASVLRDGQQRTIRGEALVPGDIVLLKSGDKVPADLRLITTTSLHIQEAILTGESVAVEKLSDPVAPSTPLAERQSMAYSGCLVTYGLGTGVVVATGEETEIGRISTLMAELPEIKTPLLKRIDKFVKGLTLFILSIAVITFIFGLLFRDYALKEIFMAAVSIAVAAIPAGLPAVLTITLAIGVIKMANRNAIVRRLPAVETLGSVTVICTDKTGTLTHNELVVKNIVTADHEFMVTGSGYAPTGEFKLQKQIIDVLNEEELMKTIQAAFHCNDAALIQENKQWHLQGTPMDGALLSLGMKAKFEREKRLTRIDLIPFESAHKFMATLNQDNENRIIFVKGAPEQLLEKCQYQLQHNEMEKLAKHYWQQQINQLAESGQRVLAVAMKPVSANQQQLKFADINQLTMLGLLGIIDNPRAEAITAVAECQRAGINVKMVTGDHSATAVAIAEQLGIEQHHQFLTGHDLDQLSNEELAEQVVTTQVFARTTPEHKIRLIDALKSKGHVVSMTGDGVNDAPALKRADIGVAMGWKGTEAAKEASEIVLADDNFATIANAVKQGRTVYDNVKKTILFMLPGDVGEALIVFTAILFGVTLPITPLQILWVNMVTAVTLALALAFELPEKNIMERPPRNPRAPIFSRFLLWRIIFVGILLLIGTFGLFWWTYADGYSIAVARTVAINVIVFAQAIYLFNTRWLTTSVLTWQGIFGSRPIWITILAVTLLQLAFTYLGPMQYLFNTAGINLQQWGFVFAFIIIFFLLIELEKWIVGHIKKNYSL